ncbi:MAG TPA: RNA polymerase sigma factor [Trebonia sp.]|jgi:RNA polymerase sigma-70 factor (ECF subfamily)|nr:RNA polymerase sigma factor [Trebonia sp.]
MSKAATDPQPSDTLLWQRVTNGDHDAFGELFDRHAGMVYTHLYRRLGDWPEAEDLTSAVFLHAWRRRSQVVFDRDSALPWLLGVANGLLRNAARSRRRHAALMARIRTDEAAEGASRVYATMSWSPGPTAGQPDGEREAARLRAAIDKLPRHQREVIELCALGGLDQATAAVALGVRPGTVKSRLSRARRALAAEFETREELA